MAQASVLPKMSPARLVAEPVQARPISREPTFPFQSLVIAELPNTPARSSATFSVSLTIHALLVVAIVILPLLWYDTVPTANERSLRAFFVELPNVTPPPPPPPPPPPAPAGASRPVHVSEPVRPLEPAAFVAPIELPDRIVEEKVDFGFEGGVPGGVEGGVPGGDVGGVVGGLPLELTAPPETAPIVRVGGSIAAPKRIHYVVPSYPEVARAARLSGTVVLEAVVDATGRVESVKVVTGKTILEEAAMEAVRQWRYQPLLLNGVPTRFVLTVIVNYGLGLGGQLG